MPRALLSVHDKTGLADLGRELTAMGWDMVASGGTASALANAGLPVTPVEQVTHQPEMLGGRVKTLHPAIHGGILARDTDADMQALNQQGYVPISLVVCNLYPFQQTVSRPNVTLAEAIEQIDIGGVTLLRAAAKNFARVVVLCDPDDYVKVVAELRVHGAVSADTRQKLAVKAFEQTRDYDTAIHAYLCACAPDDAPADSLPDTLSLSVCRIDELRYGENPHQKAARYAASPDAGPLGGTVLGGKALSYNNLLDLDSAWRAVESFERPTVVIVKHLNPCGIASGSSLDKAYPLAFASDPVSAYGGVLAVNRPVDETLIAALGDIFLEAIAAPEFTPTAQRILAEKRKNCRLLCIAPEAHPSAFEFRSIRGGVLAQTIDLGDPDGTEWRVVSKRAPTLQEFSALKFAWKACQFVKSNAIVLASGVAETTVGIGGGLPSRVDSARLAAEKAGDRAKGSVMASDAFFPFPDGAQVGIDAGVTAIVAPGGSIRDDQIIAAVNTADVAMVFTGIRHFRH